MLHREARLREGPNYRRAGSQEAGPGGDTGWVESRGGWELRVMAGRWKEWGAGQHFRPPPPRPTQNTSQTSSVPVPLRNGTKDQPDLPPRCQHLPQRREWNCLPSGLLQSRKLDKNPPILRCRLVFADRGELTSTKAAGTSRVTECASWVEEVSLFAKTWEHVREE